MTQHNLKHLSIACASNRSTSIGPGAGGLADLFTAPLPSDGPIGEAWALSDRDDRPSPVAPCWRSCLVHWSAPSPVPDSLPRPQVRQSPCHNAGQCASRQRSPTSPMAPASRVNDQPWRVKVGGSSRIFQTVNSRIVGISEVDKPSGTMAFSLFVYPVRARLQPCRKCRRINPALAAEVRLSIRSAGYTIFENALDRKSGA
jgi:hypothetical protein